MASLFFAIMGYGRNVGGVPYGFNYRNCRVTERRKINIV